MAGLGGGVSVEAQSIDAIVITGDNSPDGNGIFPTLDDSFSVPVINNAGQVFFTGSLFNSTVSAHQNHCRRMVYASGFGKIL